MQRTIGNPLSWSIHALGSAADYVGVIVAPAADPDVRPQTRRLTLSDLGLALRKGWADLGAMRSDIMFVCLIYPLMGAALLGLAAQDDQAHLIFPALSGFALIGPVAALGLYEISRRREAGVPVTWLALFDVLYSPRFPRILMLSCFNGVIFIAWMLLANTIYDVTLGPEPPASLAALLRAVVSTPAGWALAGVGGAVGLVLAIAVLAVSVVSFPLLLDRDVSLPVAVTTSVQVARDNPVVIGAWGLIVALGLTLGMLPLLAGLILVLPVLGHATWHLYRAAVV